ncbi:translation initiation factor IF-2 subunit alpha [Nanoarchaeota archaeon]
MLLIKKGFPEEGELLMCTVTNIQYHSVFVNIDEYKKTGLIHISEIAPGRIRNIRNYVEEGKKVICKVLKIDKEKGHIDLSLRRVNEGQKRVKVSEIKQQQMCEKMIENIAKAQKKDPIKTFTEISDKLLEKYPSIYTAFEDVASDKIKLSDFGIDAKISEALTEVIKSRIKESIVTISGDFKLHSFDSNGIDIIKETLKKLKGKQTKVVYAGSGTYKVTVTASDYKEAEKILEKATEEALEYIHKKKGFGEFKREAKT